MSALARTALAVLLGVLPACARYRPLTLDPGAEARSVRTRPEHPAPCPVPSALRASPWLPIAEAVDLGDGLDLAEADRVALSYAPSILEVRGRVRVAEAQLGGAGRIGAPDVFLGWRIGIEDSGLVLPASLIWNLPLGDQLAAERGVAWATLAHARAQVLQAEVDLLANVRRAFVEAAVLEQKERILVEAVDKGARLVGYATRLRDIGESSPVAEHLARLERDELDAELEETLAARGQNRAHIFGLIGLLPDADVALVPGGVLLEGARAGTAEAMPEAHPDALVARAAHTLAEQELRDAVAGLNPTLSLGPDYELDRGDNELGLAAGLTLPMGSRQQARIAAARARSANARQAYRAVLVALSSKEAAARAQWEAAERRMRGQAAREKGADEAEAALEARVEAGEIELLEVLATHAAVARSRVREWELRQRKAEADLDVAEAAGHLTVRPSRENAR